MSLIEQASDQERWQCLGPILGGGTVFSVGVLARERGISYYIATGSGVFVSEDGGETWEQRIGGLTTPLISALGVAPNGLLIAGSLNADLFRSLDFGRTWERGTQGWDAEGTVTAIAFSPNFEEDGNAFAALDGGALMATRNFGKHWEDASFGLNSMTVLAVAVVPVWERYEVLFASTEAGVYVSRNGGRAWRPTPLMLDDPVVVLVVSPAYSLDRTIYAGTETGSLYVSRDDGRTWDMLQERIGEGSFNCLWIAPDFGASGRMVAGVGNGIYLSNDRGATWFKAADMPGTVLSLAGNAEILLAGLHDAGVYKSLDRGQTWVSATGNLSARGFSRLGRSAGYLYAMGPQEGLFISQDQGASWQEVQGLEPFAPLSAVALPGDGQIFVANQELGIVRGRIGGKTWRLRCEHPGVSALLIIPEENLGLAGTVKGELLISKDGGMSWQLLEDSPVAEQEVLNIVASPTFAKDHTLYMGTAIEGTRVKPARVALWRSYNQGRTWHQIATQETDARWVDIQMPLGITENVADQAVLATGPFCLRPLRRAKDIWISTVVDPKGANVLNVAVIGEIDNGAKIYAATGSGVFRSTDGGRTWHTFSEGMEGASIVGLTALEGKDGYTLYAMTLGGVLWKRRVA